ncbi:MAG: hypothetical protein EHM35_02765 [Planctomycetaceae bacterium]|nr:MAG: hypothetical protein EHM35_02765 [Planctomycetaceae bacterium]
MNDGRNLSLQELIELKAKWLEEAVKEGGIEACIVVADQLGQPVKLHYPHSENTTAKEWRSGDVKIALFKRQTYWLADAEKYNQECWFTVTAKEHVVCHYFQSDDKLQKRNNLFVPGAWMQSVLAWLPEAHRSLRDIVNTSKEEERQELLSELLIGISV